MARQLFGEGRKLEGERFTRYLEAAPAPLREAIDRGGDTLFTLELAGEPQVYHVSQRRFLLNALPHRLLLLKQLTREINSQEVATWKKVIRVIAHELNNSLAPISSLAHSGPDPGPRAARPGAAQPRVRDDRGPGAAPRRLHRRLCAVRQAAQAASGARVLGRAARKAARGGRVHARRAAAAARRELRHRAARAGVDQSAQECARIRIGRRPTSSSRCHAPAQGFTIEVRDRGPGFTAAALENALVPFYSTKETGTGLGLTLCREIVEAHGGRLRIANREGGGALVALWLPDGS